MPQLGNDCLVHFFPHCLWHVSLYSFSEESCSAGCLSTSLVNSQSYTSSKTIVESNSFVRIVLLQRHGVGFAGRGKVNIRQCMHSHVSLCFICTSSHQVAIVLPSERNLLQVFIATIK